MTTDKSLAQLMREEFDSEKVEHKILGRTVYTSPVSIEEQGKINAKHPDDAIARMIETIFEKTVDADGKKVFSVDDKAILRRKVKFATLNRLMAAIVGEGVEAAKKE